MILSDDLKNKINKAEVISFDIFDTLLLRPYLKPTDLFRHMEEAYHATGFATARIEAEKTIRKLHREKEEVSLDEIYEQISESFQNFKEKELEWEAEVSQPNLEVKQIFDYARSLGKRLIIISDMYLSRQFLAELLSRGGVSGYEKLYVSSEMKLTKHTGNLYQYVCHDLNLSPEKILHIGDNEHSDVSLAHLAGLLAYHYITPLAQLLQSNPRAARFKKLNADKLGASILLV